MTFILPTLSEPEREQLTARAMQVLEAQQQLAEWGGPHAFMLEYGNHKTADGRNVKALQQGFIADWHYPKGDRIDYGSGGQYFYHCHREDMDTEEHGHFHCFIRKVGWDDEWRLVDIPEKDKYDSNPMTHIGCISLNRYGQPIRLFMVNRWVSYESWFDARVMQQAVRRYDVSNVKEKHREQDEKWRVVDQWVGGLVAIFTPQLQWLYEQRDAMMDKAVANTETHDAYRDKAYEELGSIDISLEKQVEWIAGG